MDTNVHSTIIHNCQKVEMTQMSINGWMDKKMWSNHTMEYYSAMQTKEVLVHAPTQMKLDHMMLSERTRHKRSHSKWFHLYETSRIETESKVWLPEAQWGVGVGEKLLKGYGVLFWSEAKVLECTKCHWIVHFKIVNFMLCEFHLNTFFLKSSSLADSYVCYCLCHPKILPITCSSPVFKSHVPTPHCTGVGVWSKGVIFLFWGDDLKTLSGPIRSYVEVALGEQEGPAGPELGGPLWCRCRGRESKEQPPQRKARAPKGEAWVLSAFQVPCQPLEVQLGLQSHALPSAVICDLHYCIC